MDIRPKLKKEIAKKFGSQSQFARLAGIDRMRLQILWVVKNPDLEFLAQVRSLLHRVKPKPSQEPLTPKLLKLIRGAINASGGVGPFCKENKGFSRDTINQIVAGRYKTQSAKVKELLAHLKIK